MSMELRLLLAFILMGVVLFVNSYLFRGPSNAKKVTTSNKAAQTTQPATSGPAQVAPATPEAPAEEQAAAAAPVAAQAEETKTIETDFFKVTFSNRGAVIKSWQLKKYKAHSGAPLELVNAGNAGVGGRWKGKFDLGTPGGQPDKEKPYLGWKSLYLDLKVDGEKVTGTAYPEDGSQYDIADGQQVNGELTFNLGFGDDGKKNPLAFKFNRPDGDAVRGVATGNGVSAQVALLRQRPDAPGALFFPGAKPSVDLNQALFKVDQDGLRLNFEFSNGTLAARKTFAFRQASYLLDVTTQVMDGGKPIAQEFEWRGGFGDMLVANPAGAQQTLRYDINKGKLEKEGAKAAKDGPAPNKGNFSFAGIEDQYFVAAFLPAHPMNTVMTTFSDSTGTPAEPRELPFAGVGVGDATAGPNEFALYVGPKDIDILRSVNPRLEQAVDFGFFGFLAKPLFLIVHWSTEQVIHNYGWSIILVTIVLNFALFPLKITSMKSMKKMQALQPQIQAINEKYKGIGLRDPKKADQNQEVMELYKKHGVNPMGGCVPMLLQIPFFIAFYKVFSVSVEMRGANWLWVTDLSQPETLPIHLLPIIMVISQFAMQKMTPTTPGGDPNQQRMMQFMPLIFGFMFYNLSSGLVLYYLTSNLVGVAQQLFFNRTSLATVAAQSVQPPKKKKDGRK